MNLAFIVGPLAALIGIGAVFFVFRRKAVDKRSMYSARRSQIEHKVRAARQRTLAPHGHEEKAPEPAAEPTPASPFTSSPRGPQITYEASAYEPPPAAPPPVGRDVRDVPAPSPWDVGTPAAPAPTEFVTPEAPPAPTTPEPAYNPPPVEEVWTPAPAPPPAPVEPVRPAAAAASPAAWSVVREAKDSAEVAEKPKKKGKQDREDPGAPAAWTLASGDEPGMESDDILKTQSPWIGVAQYAVLVVGLVMVLIGVFVMIANSHVT